MDLLKQHGKGVSLAFLFSNDKFLSSDRAAVIGLLEQVKLIPTYIFTTNMGIEKISHN